MYMFKVRIGYWLKVNESVKKFTKVKPSDIKG